MLSTTTETGLFDLLTEMPGLILGAEMALETGAFDAGARAQAESLIADARRLFSELLREAWPDDTANTAPR